jgi:hypothetical protein
MKAKTTPIQVPVVPTTGFSVSAGAPIPKLARLRIMESGDWEDFITEWASSVLKPIHGYFEVDHAGAAGDMGRDVIGYIGSLSGPYDNFQCKHYNHPLYPGDVWLEIGKLCYWTFKGEFQWPRQYKFVAPQGVGTTLFGLLENPEELKRQFKSKWDSDCGRKIIGGQTLAMSADFARHIDLMDFSVFGAVPPATIVEEHLKTPFHIVRFGGGLPARVDAEGPPQEIPAIESRYVRQLLDVYAEHSGAVISSSEDLETLDEAYNQHLKTSREEFFSAECINKSSRD